jgi:hypothetical protein
MPAPLSAAENRRRWDAYVANDRNGPRSAAALDIKKNTFNEWLSQFRERVCNFTFQTTGSSRASDGHNPSPEFWRYLEKAGELGAVRAEQNMDAEELERLRQENERLKRKVIDVQRNAKIETGAVDDLRDELVTAHKIRDGVIGLVEAATPPIVYYGDKSKRRGGERTALLHISDMHLGEHVDLDEMDGLNSYNAEICQNRMRRLFQTTASLLTEHWKGDPVEELVVVFGGDMISGIIHDELLRTNDLTSIGQVDMAASILAGGVKFLREKVKAPVRIYTTPGNHSRLAQKPQVKSHAVDSYDTLVSWMVEHHLADDPGVEFFYTGSGEALFNIYGWWIMAQHGHMGAGGTGGMYGPAYKQVRSMYKAHWTYARRGRGFHYAIEGHNHTTTHLPFGIANGSVIGYNEYAGHKLKADPEVAKQNLIIFERQLGIIARQDLYLGRPEEGALYTVPEAPSVDDPSRYAAPGRKMFTFTV